MSKNVKAKKKGFDVTFDYNDDIVMSCACGAEYKSGSTLSEVRVDICANCHPFFTGENKIVDSEGRVEKFKKKYAKFSK
ncbi:MAG: 50S ribosomal protein L31 [Candidatus Margulisiibacteriota bacterium]